MKISAVSSYVFLGSLFGLVVVWGYLPTLWVVGVVPWILVGLSLAALIVWIVFSLERLQVWLKQRSTQFGLSLVLTAVALFGVLGTVNYLAVKFNKKKDLTANQLHTLSDQTKRVLEGLKENVTIRVWSTATSRMSANLNMDNFFENYRIAGKGKVTVELKSPNEDRLAAIKDGVKKDNLIIIRASSGREARVESFSDSKGEEQVTNAIINALKGTKKTICFLTGHRELSLSDTNPEGLSTVKTRLEESAFSTQEVSLTSANAVPVGCEVLVIAGPQTEPTKDEMNRIQAYLDAGGKVLGLISAGAPESWRKLAQSYGVVLRENLVFDPQVQPPVIVHTKNFARDVEWASSLSSSVVLLPQSSSWEVPTKAPDADTKIQTFLSSENVTFAKAGSLRSITSASRLPSDLRGPLPLGVWITRPVKGADLTVTKKGDVGADKSATKETEKSKETQLILLGSHLFASNALVGQLANADLFLNATSVLSQDKDLVGIRPKEIRQASLDLKPENLRQVYATLLLVALAFLLGGVFAQRRRQVDA